MATPGICNGFGKAAVGIIGTIAAAAGSLVLFFYSIGSPVSGMILGIILGLINSYPSNKRGDKRSMSISGAVAGACGGALSKEFGGAAGALAGTFAALAVFFVTLSILHQLFENPE